MKTESIFWSKNFEIYRYVSEHFGETVRLEEGDTIEQAQQFAEINVLKRVHAKHPHLKEVYPLPQAASNKPIVKQQHPVQPARVFTDKVITIQKGAALVECIKNCNNLSQLKGYAKFLDSDAAEQAYNDKTDELSQIKTA